MKTRDRWLIVSAAAAAAVYAVLWIGYVSQWTWLADLDAAGLAGPYRYGSVHPTWVTAWDVLCTVLGPFAFRLLAAVLIAVALLRRQRRIALFLFLTIELSGLTTELAKFVVDRPRPATAMVHALSTSFPSGHALGVLVAVLALLVVAWPGIRPSLRLWWALAGVLIVIAVGVGRVVLNVHHPSDVVAGWALGYVWFVAIYLLCRRRGQPLRQRPKHR
ncbi:phosphatase PAP2 family protein [Mycobacteroides abscessus subsp. abscessus]|uniref:phosphatase PAP2 family protein n=1 Tax=Mycolicibacterium fortuitum TaxID=1766 RepID=UPI001CDC2238|nr:phosphatase PAP2 family protein [Mycolicibacterium fortuitum]MDO3240693.1 phosphatase PAP2 family protein [Mycobacteroides abscessus subsp. abscessus]UBV21249.1 phosphatase PAP2 family protein [Mycolicibacterium fortuitum]